MKNEKKIQKLRLHKDSLRRLTDKQLADVVGGAPIVITRFGRKICQV